MFIIGVAAMILGTLDPLEGSVLILGGTFLMLLTTYLLQDRQWKLFLASFLMILTGVFFLFYFSSLGGFGGKSELSWWWGTLILPYPAGWLMNVVVLIRKAIQKPAHQATSIPPQENN